MGMMEWVEDKMTRSWGIEVLGLTRDEFDSLSDYFTKKLKRGQAKRVSCDWREGSPGGVVSVTIPKGVLFGQYPLVGTVEELIEEYKLYCFNLGR